MHLATWHISCIVINPFLFKVPINLSLEFSNGKNISYIDFFKNIQLCLWGWCNSTDWGICLALGQPEFVPWHPI